MEFLAHITEVEFPLGLVLYIAGIASGLIAGYALWGRSPNRPK